MEFTCSICGSECETEQRLFGDDVKCWNCGAQFKTEMEEDYDNLYFWVTDEIGNDDSPVKTTPGNQSQGNTNSSPL